VSEESLTTCVETLLPFDLETTFCSGIIVLIASFVEPMLLPDLRATLQNAYDVLDELDTQGNLIARRRVSELKRLGQMLETLESRDVGEATTSTPAAMVTSPTSGHHNPDEPPNQDSTAHVNMSPNDPLATTDAVQPFEQWTWEDALSSAQLMNVADFLEENTFDGFSNAFDV
jgi:hypothetical protein